MSATMKAPNPSWPSCGFIHTKKRRLAHPEPYAPMTANAVAPQAANTAWDQRDLGHLIFNFRNAMTIANRNQHVLQTF